MVHMDSDTVLLQVSFSKDGNPVTDIDQIRQALDGSAYGLDVGETERNGNVPVIRVANDAEAVRLMELNIVRLPSGYMMEIPMP